MENFIFCAVVDIKKEFLPNITFIFNVLLENGFIFVWMD